MIFIGKHIKFYYTGDWTNTLIEGIFGTFHKYSFSLTHCAVLCLNFTYNFCFGLSKIDIYICIIHICMFWNNGLLYRNEWLNIYMLHNIHNQIVIKFGFI